MIQKLQWQKQQLTLLQQVLTNQYNPHHQHQQNK